MTRTRKSSILSHICGLAAAAVVVVAPAGAALTAPIPVAPSTGATVDALPTFAWDPVSGADRYEFEIAADAGFNSPVLGLDHDHFFTRNTRATLKKVVPNGTYWWHVRSVGADGSVSAWSSGRSFTKNWASSPLLSSPADGATIRYPSDPFRLAWTPVDGAAKYIVSLATDPTLGSVVWPTGPVTTQATAFTLSSPLAPDKTYYWGITPLDAAGNRGAPSDVRSFRWEWPSTTTPVVTDIATAPEIDDYEFSWNPVPGAAGYELEVNRSSDWAAGSKVCCTPNSLTGRTTIGTTYSPTEVLPNNNSYYWRVRAVDSSGNAGVWNEGPTFTKRFDSVVPSVKNLRMLDNPFPSDGDFETTDPVITWDPVPGASAYEVEVTRHTGGCQWTASVEHWLSKTATTSWTPLGSGWNGIKPYQSPLLLSTDIPALVAGHSYCVRVTALDKPSSPLKPYVRSVETYLPDVNNPAFTWTGPPAGGACSPSCNVGAMGNDDYLLPIRGETRRRMPLLRWKPLAGYESYFVLVSSDPEFTNLVDYAFTQLPSYAPRTGFGTKAYADETNVYYWAVLPATGRNGAGVVTAPQFSAPANFLKQSIPPVLMSPTDGTTFASPVRFRWAPAEAAQHYRLQVSKDPSFSKPLETVVTDSTAYTSSTPYDADVALYWRVRADAESADQPFGVGLTWSQTGTFTKTLPAPVPDPANPTGGDAVPTWKWGPVAGAVSYNFELRAPNGITQVFTGIPSAAATPTVFKGTGIWSWRVRANFPRVDQFAVVQGPWSPVSSFTRTIREPTNASEEAGARRLVFRWDPKLGAFNYRVQVSTRPDFSFIVENTSTENTRYAPFLSLPAYMAGGTFYWRVAAADDAAFNVGDFTATRSFSLPAQTTGTKAATTTTASVTKTSSKVKVTGMVSPGHPGKTVVVKLFRKKNGVFVRLARKNPVLSSVSTYAVSFARPRPGACKVKSTFAGDTDHLASSKAVKFRC